MKSPEPTKERIFDWVDLNQAALRSLAAAEFKKKGRGFIVVMVDTKVTVKVSYAYLPREAIDRVLSRHTVLARHLRTCVDSYDSTRQVAQLTMRDDNPLRAGVYEFGNEM